MRMRCLWNEAIEALVFFTVALILLCPVASGLHRAKEKHAMPRETKEVRIWRPENLDPTDEAAKFQVLRGDCQRGGYHTARLLRREGGYLIFELVE